MAAVIGAARTLQDRWRLLSADQREAFLALIADETNRLAALIGDVLDTSRIEAGTFSYSFADVDLGRLVKDAVATASVGQDEVIVRATVAERVPRIRGDRERLRQVLTNLIDNAIKYSPCGRRSQRQGAAGERRCAHHASPIAAPAFPTTSRDSSSTSSAAPRFAAADRRPGTGLGLFIARSIAEAHGGSVEVQSRPGEGATFILTLPVTP